MPASEDFLANAAALDDGVLTALEVACTELDSIIALRQHTLADGKDPVQQAGE